MDGNSDLPGNILMPIPEPSFCSMAGEAFFENALKIPGIHRGGGCEVGECCLLIGCGAG
jgi:hypothetical protein